MSLIEEAKKRKKRIAFRYVEVGENGEMRPRMNGYRYIVSPYYVIASHGWHYLLCCYREKYRPLQLFRLDRMKDIEIKEDWDLKPITALKGLEEGFSIADYVADRVYMIDGESIDAEFALDDESAAMAVRDWFGERAKVVKRDGRWFATVKGSENALYYWTMQYGDAVTAIGPARFVDRVKKGWKEMCKRYE